MKRLIISGGTSATIAFALLTPSLRGAAAQVVAYEGFNYGGTPNIQAANGGTGWGGGWNKLSSIPTGAVPAGLAWAGLPASGGCAVTAAYPSADYTRYSRVIGAYSAPAGEVWISFLFEPNTGFGVGGGLAFGTWENGMIVGLVPGSGHYGLSGFTGPSSLSDDAPVLGESVLLLARARLQDDATVAWSLFVNPPLDGPLPVQPDAAMAIPGTVLPAALSIYNDGGFLTDEIRVATTWWAALGQPAPCTGDLNGDGAVGGADLGVLLAQWGGPGSADLNGSGTVDGADLGFLLASWGPCP